MNAPGMGITSSAFSSPFQSSAIKATSPTTQRYNNNNSGSGYQAATQYAPSKAQTSALNMTQPNFAYKPQGAGLTSPPAGKAADFGGLNKFNQTYSSMHGSIYSTPVPKGPPPGALQPN